MLLPNYGFSLGALSENPIDQIAWIGDATLALDWELRIFAATHEYISRTTDDPIDTAFKGTLSKAFRIDRSIIGPSFIGLEITIGVGEIVLINTEGDYDILTFQSSPLGQRVTIKCGDRRKPYATWLLVLDGFLVDMTMDREQVTFRARDGGWRLDVPASPNLYLGTGDVEGTADLKDKRKPRFFGHVLNVTPPLVIPSTLSYQLNDGPIEAVDAVYVRGAALTLDADYISVGAMQAASLYIGTYATCLAEGWIRIGVANDEELGEVTCDFRGDKADATFVETASDIVRRLIGATDITDPDELVTGTFTSLNTTQSAPIGYGIPVGSEETVAASIANIMASIGGWCGARRTGRFEVQRFGVPSGDPGDTFTALLHFNGDDDTTTITDLGNHTWTAVSNAQIDTSQSKFGGASVQLAGGTDSVTGDGSADFAFGTGDFTIDLWFFPTDVTTDAQALYEGRPTATNGFYPSIQLADGNKVKFRVNGADVIVGTTILAASAWYHVAVTRSGTSTKLFLNGVQEGSTWTDTSNYISAGASTPTIGRNRVVAAPFIGWIDELRVVKGSAMWTANFTPPAAPYRQGTTLSSVPVYFYDKKNIIDISIGTLPETLLPPPWRIRVSYGKNWTPNQTNLAGTVSETRRAFLAEEYRYAAAEDNDVRLNFPPGQELVVNTYFRNQGDAEDEASRLLALYTAARTVYIIKLAQPLYIHELGDLISVQWDGRFDLDTAKLMRVVKITEDDQEGVELTAFG